MKLSLRTLVTILTLFAVIFVLFMSLTIYGTILTGDNFQNDGALRDPAKDISALSEIMSAESLKNSESSPEELSSAAQKTVAIVMTLDDGAACESAKQWSVYSKFSYRVFNGFSGAAQLSTYDFVIFDSCPSEPGDIAELEKLCENGAVLIFCRLCDAHEISQSQKLREILGIATVEDEAYEIDGVHLYKDFYLSSDRLYIDDDYYGEEDDMRLTIPYFTLSAGYEVYAAAVLDDQDALEIENEKLPPLLWKATCKNSQVCVINSRVFAGDALMGTLTAFASRTSRDGVYIYPVVNAQANSIMGYPWLQKENDEQLYYIYGHESDTLSRSVLWPGVVQTLYVYHQTADFYVSAHTDYLSETVSKDDRMANYSIRQVHKTLGTLGLSLKQRSSAPIEDVISANEEYFERIVPSWRFSSVYAGNFTIDELKPYLEDKDGFLGDVSMVLTDRKLGDPIISTTEGDVVVLGLTSYSFAHEALDDIALLANETALAFDNQYVDMNRVMYPESADDYWNNLSIDWSSAATYYNDFSKFDFVLATELEDRVRNLLLTDCEYKTGADKIVLSVDKPKDTSVYFIVRMFTKKPVGVEGGELTQLTDSSYLLKADADVVTILQEPLYRLEGPE